MDGRQIKFNFCDSGIFEANQFGSHGLIVQIIVAQFCAFLRNSFFQFLNIIEFAKVIFLQNLKYRFTAIATEGFLVI